MRKALTLIVMLLVVTLTIACEAGKKGSGVEGKLVDGNGKPMVGVKLIAKQVQPIKGYEQKETVSGSDGTFKFKGLFPSAEYVVEPWSDMWKAMDNITVQSGPEGETSMRKEPFVLRLTLSKAGVVTDSKTGIQWAPSNGEEMTHSQAEEYVKSLNLDGGGWRLPTIKELEQLNPQQPLLNAKNTPWAGELCNNWGAPGAIIWAGGCVFLNSKYRVIAVRYPK